MMLDAANLRLIGARGLGNPRSRVAHASTLFEGRLYLGVTHPNGDGPEDCARILRHDFTSGDWAEVHRSPVIEADGRAAARDVLRPTGGAGRAAVGAAVPRDRGYRGMAVFQGTSDRRPALYASTISNWGGLILRSADGDRFEVVSKPGLGDERLLSFRALVPFRGKLFTTPIGSVADGTLDRNGTVRPQVFVSDDPASGVWHEAGAPGFGDPRNEVVFQMAALGEHLYAGTGNPKRGFEIWRTDAEGPPPYRWERVLERGAWRFNRNLSAASMVAFGGALWIGTGLPGLGYDRANDVGPAASELIRLEPDGRWEVVVGEPRFSPQGLKIPLSAMGPGFDDSRNSVFWRMAVYDGRLYVGTHQWGCYAFLSGRDDQPRGGFHLWSTENGEDWHAVTRDGFGNPFAVGVRTLLPTPHGLVIGTDDHSLLRRRAERQRGLTPAPAETGCEVWLLEDPGRAGPPVLGPWG